MRRRFATLDVFTDRRFAGNPLAVVLDTDALDAAAMQAIAREFNHPETVFVFAPADPAHRARVRIFTPARELPFAGHPTVGTAVLLGARDGGGRDIVLEEGIGAVRGLGRCEHEHRLGVVELARDRLHRRRLERFGVKHDGEWIAGKAPVGEHVERGEAPAHRKSPMCARS